MLIEKENLGRLSNDELFKALKGYGIQPGPITTTTRFLYEKKLRAAIEKGGATVKLQNTELSPTRQSTATPSPVKVASLVENNQPSSGYKMTTRRDKENTVDTTSSNNENNFEISITSLNGTQEPVVKVTNPNASKIIIEKTTTTITHTPNSPSTTSTHTVQQSPAVTTTTPSSVTAPVLNRNVDLQRQATSNARIADSSAAYATTNYNTGSSSISNIQPATQYYQRPAEIIVPSSNYVSSSISSSNGHNMSTVGNLLNTTRQSAQVPRDKFAERLENYGLLRSDEKVDTLSSKYAPTVSSVPAATVASSSSSSSAYVSPMGIRSRAPIHSDRASSSGTFTSYTKQPNVDFKATASSAAKTDAGAPLINWKYLLFVAVMTAIVYFFIIHMQPNPDNPIE